jgi:hypothetical protein
MRPGIREIVAGEYSATITVESARTWFEGLIGYLRWR